MKLVNAATFGNALMMIRFTASKSKISQLFAIVSLPILRLDFPRTGSWEVSVLTSFSSQFIGPLPTW